MLSFAWVVDLAMPGVGEALGIMPFTILTGVIAGRRYAGYFLIMDFITGIPDAIISLQRAGGMGSALPRVSSNAQNLQYQFPLSLLPKVMNCNPKTDWVYFTPLGEIGTILVTIGVVWSVGFMFYFAFRKTFRLANEIKERVPSHG